MYLQKVICRKTFFKICFCWRLEGQWWKQQDPDPLVRREDPRIRIHTKMSWILNTAGEEMRDRLPQTSNFVASRGQHRLPSPSHRWVKHERSYFIASSPWGSPRPAQTPLHISREKRRDHFPQPPVQGTPQYQHRLPPSSHRWGEEITSHSLLSRELPNTNTSTDSLRLLIGEEKKSSRASSSS